MANTHGAEAAERALHEALLALVDEVRRLLGVANGIGQNGR